MRISCVVFCVERQQRYCCMNISRQLTSPNSARAEKS